jgi:D-glycero-D-manno-heptose 1,7-bisphosphate phosphatase
MNKCLFLDRDGVINHDPGDYTYELNRFKILPDVIDVIRKYKENGYLVIVITNQGGIAKGIYSKKDMFEVHDFMLKEFASNNAQLTDIFYSLHHNAISASIDRKPDSLMLERAIYLYQIDPSMSLMVGDKPSDVQAAEKVGVEGVLIDRNSSLRFLIDRLERD